MNYDKLVIMRGDYLHERYNNQSADIYFLNYKLTYCSHGDPGDYLKYIISVERKYQISVNEFERY